MRSAADIAAEMDEGLARLFQAGLELSLQVQADAMACETPQDRAKQALAFHRLSRSVRQTAALRMRIARDAEQSGREAWTDGRARDKARRERHAVRAKADIERLVWTEYEHEDPDAEALLEHLDVILAAEAETEHFLIEDPQVQFARLCKAVGYEPPANATPTVIPRSSASEIRGTQAASPQSQPGSPASAFGRAEDDGGVGADSG